MITDKEYPATHSMSTAWYMVDAEGNVGLMAFDDNGPVPEFNRVPPDLALSDLIFGQGFSADETCKGIHLNRLQIHELLGQPIKPIDVTLWNEVCLVIAPECTAEFLFLCKNPDITNYGCISSEMNLFFVDAFDCIDFHNGNIIKGSTLDKMIKANMITAIYQVPCFHVSSDYDHNTDSVVFTHHFDNPPYYIYCQPYWTSDPQHRINVPSTPVKISQIDKQYREQLLHIPVRFKDTEDIQIAQWFVCNTYEPKLLIGDAGYSLLPIDKHTKKYCLTNPFFFDFYEHCPDKDTYGCTTCNQECASSVRFINSLKPTIFYIVAPTRRNVNINQLDLPQEIIDNIAILSYIPKLPYKEPRRWMDLDQVKKRMTAKVLTALLSASHGWFERVMQSINPQVIIIDDEALPVFSTVFPVINNVVLINNTNYTIYTKSSVKQNNKTILTLAETPYRGTNFKETYTEQEAHDLIQQGKAFEHE